MQYTGLKDKNGVKIFEGDIVKIYNWSMFDGELLGKASVYFCDDMGYWQTDPMIISNQYDFYNKAVFEVVGNIHETED